jgi:alpha-methylacyl-CoA racemase
MSVGALEPQFFAELVRVLDIPDFPAQNDVANWPTMRELMTEKFASKTRAEWIDAFAGVDACVAPIWRLSEALNDPHLLARKTLVEANGSMQPAPAPRFSRTPGAIGAAAKKPGTDTTEALTDWGIKNIDDLLAKGVVTQA